MLVVSEAETCIVDVYELKVATSEWSIVSLFGRGGIATIDQLTAAGWTVNAVNDFRATAEHSGFWCGGACSGSISYSLPSGSTRARLTVGMSYDNPSVSVPQLEEGSWTQLHIYKNATTLVAIHVGRPSCYFCDYM